MNATMRWAHAPTWMKRWVVGLVAGLVALGAAGGAWAPKAEAQGSIPIDLILSVCGAEGGDGNTALGDCIKNTWGDIDDMITLGECMANRDEGGDDSDSGGEDDDSDGEDSGGVAESGLRDCMNEVFGEDDEDDEDSPAEGSPDDYSLYRMNSALSAFYANSMIPGGGSDSGSGNDDEDDEDTEGDTGGGDTAQETEAGEGLEAWRCVLNNPATAGAVIGNPNQDFLENRNWMFGPGDAGNDAVFRYESVSRLGEDTTQVNLSEPCEVPGAPDQGVGPYAYYGATLTGLGFDSTAARDSAATAKSSVMGTGILFAYVAAGAVDTIFDTVVGLLQTLNPFRLITDWVGTNERNSEGFREGSDPRFTEGMPGEAGGTNGAFDDLKDFLGTMYTGFVNLGWLVTIPIFIGVFFFGVLMSRRYMVGDGFKKLALRIGFLVVGIPLLGVSYTGALESLQGASGEAGTSNASRVVGSTYVDFEQWADSRLAMPSDTLLTWDIETDRPSDAAQAQARDTALKINAQSNPAFGGFSDDTETGNDEAWLSNVTGRDQEDANPQDTYTGVLNMLNRYISGQSVSSAGYESSVKAQLTELAEEHPESASEILGWIADFTSVDTIEGMSAEDVESMNNPLLQVQPDTANRAIVWGEQSSRGAGIQFLAPNDADTAGQCTPSTVVGDDWNGDVNSDNVLSNCALSPLAMFSWLNTDFGNTAMTAFSPTNTSSGWTREMHASVNAIGSGMMSYVYWFSAMTLLSSFALIGFIYGLALLFGSIKKGIQLIAAIPFALVGMLPGIAKAVSYTVAMFLEIFMTIFVYKVVQEFMMAIPALIEAPLVERLSDVDEGVGTGIGGAIMGTLMLGVRNPTTVVMVVTVTASIGIIIFTIMAVKLRSTLIQAMDEAVNGIINKLTGTQTSAASDPSAGGGVKQGLARGASMGATHAMISGGKGGDSDGKGGNDGDGNGGGTGDGGDGPDGTGNSGAGMAPVAGGVGGAAMGDDGADAAGISEADADVDGTGMAPMAGPGMELPQGDYDVDADGTLRDADGNAMVDADGNPVGLNDVANMDSDGNLTDANGNQITDHNGQPIHSSEVGGIDANGNLTDSDGAPILDGSDQPIGANMQGVETLGGQGDTMGGATSAESDQELADQVAAQGGLSSDGVGMSPAMVGAGAAAGAGAGAAAGAGATNVGGTHGGADVSGAVDNVAGRMAGSDNATAAALGNAVQGTSAQAPAGGAPVQGPVPQRSLGDNLSTLGQQATQAGRESGVYQQYGTQGAQQAAQSAAPQAQPAQQPNVQQVSNNVPMNNSGGNDGPGFGNYLAAGVVGAGVNKLAGGGQGKTQRTISESLNGGRGGGQQGGQGKPGTQGAQQAMRRSPRGGRGRVGSGMGMAAGMAMGQSGQGSGDGGQQGQHGQGEQQQSPRRGAPRNGAPSDRNQWGGGETGNV